MGGRGQSMLWMLPIERGIITVFRLLCMDLVVDILCNHQVINFCFLVNVWLS